MTPKLDHRYLNSHSYTLIWALQEQLAEQPGTGSGAQITLLRRPICYYLVTWLLSLGHGPQKILYIEAPKSASKNAVRFVWIWSVQSQVGSGQLR